MKVKGQDKNLIPRVQQSTHSYQVTYISGQLFSVWFYADTRAHTHTRTDDAKNNTLLWRFPSTQE